MASFVILLTARTARIACSDIQTDTQNDYCNPRCACAPRVNESTEVQTLGVIRIQPIYSINVLSKYSSLISHRPSIFEDRHINHRSSKVDTSIIDLRRSTHRSPKVDTSIFEDRHIVTSIVDLRNAIHRSSKVATSIFELRHIDFRRSKAETSYLQFATEHVHNFPPSP